MVQEKNEFENFHLNEILTVDLKRAIKNKLYKVIDTWIIGQKTSCKRN